jgi:hypothetical protein
MVTLVVTHVNEIAPNYKVFPFISHGDIYFDALGIYNIYILT